MTDAAVEAKTGAEEIVWDLSIFYKGIDDPAIDADIDSIRKQAAAWSERYRGRVAELSAGELNTALSEYEALRDALGRIDAFASLTYFTDTNNPAYGALRQKIEEFEAEFNAQTLFLTLEWNQLADTHAQGILNDPALGKYRHFLEAERRYKPHELSEAEEKLLVETAVTGRAAWVRLFTELWGAARFDLDGKKLTQSQIFALFFEPDRDLRRRAADAINETLREKLPQATYITNVLAADKSADDKRRGYPSWVASRHLSNKTTDAIVDALVTASTERYDIAQRHYDLKRALLGYDELYEYDRNAPLPIQAAERSYSWDEAREISQNAYAAFSPRLGDLVRRFFDEQWIHAALAPGKRGGAFASGTVPSAHPFVFMNYTGKAGDVKTLAHELGHGVHMALSAEAQGLLGSTMRLTVAEMASVFGEMLVFDDLMAKEPDPAARLAMVARSVDESIGTVFRQISMNRFEDKVHNGRRTQGELTPDQLNAFWMDTQVALYGDSVTLRDDYGMWWSYIPHFIHTPGYVYAYAFGKLLVMALFNLYRARGADFVPQYLDVLAAGDSDYPERILARVGVDLANPAFWHEGLDAIEAMVAQEEQLAREVFPDKFQ